MQSLEYLLLCIMRLCMSVCAFMLCYWLKPPVITSSIIGFLSINCMMCWLRFSAVTKAFAHIYRHECVWRFIHARRYTFFPAIGVFIFGHAAVLAVVHRTMFDFTHFIRLQCFCFLTNRSPFEFLTVQKTHTKMNTNTSIDWVHLRRQFVLTISCFFIALKSIRVYSLIKRVGHKIWRIPIWLKFYRAWLVGWSIVVEMAAVAPNHYIFFRIKTESYPCPKNFVECAFIPLQNPIGNSIYMSRTFQLTCNQSK